MICIAKNDSADLSKMAKEGTTQYFPVSAQFEKNVEKAGAGKGTGIFVRSFCFPSGSCDTGSGHQGDWPDDAEKGRFHWHAQTCG